MGKKAYTEVYALEILDIHKKYWRTRDTLRTLLVKPCALITYMTVGQHIFSWYNLIKWSTVSQLAITCSKLTIETLEQGVKFVQS